MSDVNKISELREDYREDGLFEPEMHPNPIEQFNRWMQEALDADVQQPNALTLSTATLQGRPSARVVLLKHVQEEGFVFFTNYESQKSKELDTNPLASMVFTWLPLSRQIRVEGKVVRVETGVSDEYFKKRPRGSQIGAWASQQSKPLSGREELERAFDEVEKAYREKEIPRPDHWGGYMLMPERIEFWQGRPSRLHDRIVYEKRDSEWDLKRLFP